MWKCGFFPSPSRCNCHSFYDMHYASQRQNTGKLIQKKLYKESFKPLTLWLGCKENLFPVSLCNFIQPCKKHCSKPAQKLSPMITVGLGCFIKSTEFWSTYILLKAASNIPKKTPKNVWPNYLSNSIYFRLRSIGTLSWGKWIKQILKPHNVQFIKLGAQISFQSRQFVASFAILSNSALKHCFGAGTASFTVNIRARRTLYCILYIGKEFVFS